MLKQLLIILMSVILGACAMSDVWRAGEPQDGQQPPATTTTNESTVAWPEPDAQTIKMPDNPWLAQRGQTLQRSQIERFPARYGRQHDRILILSLSGASNMQLGHRFNGTGQAVLNSGWSVLENTMRQAEQLGFEEVWFRGWTGGHPITDKLSEFAMPYPVPNDAPSAQWLVDWRRFRDRWTQRGVRIGVYVAPIVTPNFGTIDRPDFRFLTRDDFGYIEDTLAWLKQQGFEVAGLDAMSLITAVLDEPSDQKWNRTVLAQTQAPERDKGIALDLMRYLNRSSKLQGMRLIAESEMPPGPHQAEMPCMIIVQSRRGGVDNRVTIDTIPMLTGSVDELIVPGVEKIALIHGNNWTRPEYLEAVRVLEEKGYRVAVDWFVISNFQLGMLDIPGTTDRKTP